MNQTNHFFNLGYGWLCKHCSAADAEAKCHPEARNGFFKQTDSEKEDNPPSGLALASWADPAHHALTCPRCGIEETIADA